MVAVKITGVIAAVANIVFFKFSYKLFVCNETSLYICATLSK